MKRLQIRAGMAVLWLMILEGCSTENRSNRDIQTHQAEVTATQTETPAHGDSAPPKTVPVQIAQPVNSVALVDTDSSTTVDYTQTPGNLPRVIISEDGYVGFEGFPAVSADGATIVAEVYFETVSNAEMLALEFISVKNPGTSEKVVMKEATDEGRPLPLPVDSYGKTVWRRGKTLNERLVQDGFRSLLPLSRVDTDNPKISRQFEGEGLRVLLTRQSRLVVRRLDTDQRRFAGKMPGGTQAIQMESQEPDTWWADLLGVWVNSEKTVMTITYGFEYASCMTPNSVEYMAFNLAP